MSKDLWENGTVQNAAVNIAREAVNYGDIDIYFFRAGKSCLSVNVSLFFNYREFTHLYYGTKSEAAARTFVNEVKVSYDPNGLSYPYSI